MASFSSSVINKSGKRFAPKAPVRRSGTGGPSAPSSARASIERRPPSVTPQPPPVTPATGTDQSSTVPTGARPSETQEPRHPSVPSVRASPSNSDAVPIPVPGKRSPRTASESAPARPAGTSTAVSESEIRSSGQQDISPSAVEKPGPAVASSATTNTEETVNGPTKSAEASSASQSGDISDARPSKRRRLSQSTVPQPPPQPDATTSTPISTPPVQPQPRSSTQSEEPSTGRKRATPATKKTTRPAKKRKQSTDAGGLDGADGTKTPRTPRNRRQRTPEDAETIEIAPEAIKMSDLCKDLRTGRKSKREMELRKMEEKRREERRKNGQKSEKESTTGTPLRGTEVDRLPPIPSAGPQMRIVNGEIVVDTSSLQIDRHADAARNAEDMEEVEENPLTRRINQASFGKRTRVESWDEDMTDLFYKGLRMFGTDFMMISKLFPGLTRRHVKLKFSNEERKDPGRIKDTLLGPREYVDVESFSEMTNTVYDDPRVIEQELEEQKRKIHEEHAKEKEARQEMLKNSDLTAPRNANVLPSIENGNQPPMFEQKKKPTKAAARAGGTEEILGTIDDLL